MTDKEKILVLFQKYIENSISSPELTMLWAYLEKATDKELLPIKEKLKRELPKQAPVTNPTHKAKLWKKLERKINQDKGNSDPTGRKLATFLAIGLGGILVYLLLLQFPIDPNSMIGETSSGQKLTIHLSDGSRVRLNSSSKLYYPKKIAEHRREVQLDGEAFFEVHHAPQVPFVVSCGEVTATATGTSFNIRAYPGNQNVEVAVAEGEVILAHSPGRHEDLVLVANEIAYYDLKSGILTKTSQDVGDLVAWKDNVLVLDKKNLQEVADLLERWYGVEVIFEDQQVEKCLVHGRFHAPSLKEVLQELSLENGLEYQWKANTIIIGGKECPQASGKMSMTCRWCHSCVGKLWKEKFFKMESLYAAFT